MRLSFKRCLIFSTVLIFTLGTVYWLVLRRYYENGTNFDKIDLYNEENSQRTENEMAQNLTVSTPCTVTAEPCQNSRKTRSLKELGDLIQKRLHYLQNPANCTSAKKLHCTMPVCGFGCTVHRAAICFYTAYALKRMLVIERPIFNSPIFRHIIRPTSDTCNRTDSDEHSRVDIVSQPEAWINLTTINNEIPSLKMGKKNLQSWPMTYYIPGTIPQDIEWELKKQHSNPTAWFMGQLVFYLIGRFTPYIKQKIQKVKHQIGFVHPIVGLHVRRYRYGQGAKKPSHKVYMSYIEKLFITHYPDVKERRVFFMGDEPEDLPAIIREYPEYNFIYNPKSMQTARQTSGGFYDPESLLNIFLDFVLLSETDYFFGTFSSNIGRMAYELKQVTTNDNLADRAKSLDRSYHTNWYFVEELDTRPRFFIPIVNNTDSYQLNFEVGQLIESEYLYYAWDKVKDTLLYAEGTLVHNSKKGIFPLDKVIQFPGKPIYPTYEELDTE